MLSAGQLHKPIPKDHYKNLRKRLRLLDLAENDVEMQNALRTTCANDILFFINLFCFQFNPNKEIGHEVGPFITWDFQEAALLDDDDANDGPGFLWCIEHKRDLLIQKSREMGASWLCLLTLLWLFMFKPWMKFLVISRTEEEVEAEDSDALFWKLDHLLRFMPDWLKPDIKRRIKYFGNLENSSIIAGRAPTGKVGVGGRATAIFVDEFSQIREDYEVFNRTSNTSNCRIFNGTHKGLDTCFYELSNPESTVGGYIKKRFMHWTQHPEKRSGLYRFDEATGQIEVLDKQYAYPPDFEFVMSSAPLGGPYPGLRSPWYDIECKRKTSAREVAMDIDINPSGSVSQFFDPQKVHGLIRNYCVEPSWEGDILFDRDTGHPHSLMARKSGPLKLWLKLDGHGLPPAGQYVIGGDISSGQGCTPTCLEIANGTIGEQVGEYTNAFLEPSEMAIVAYALCWLFKSQEGEGAFIGWEIPGPGQAFGKKLLELGYRRVFCRPNTEKIFAHIGRTLPGWANSRKTQRILLEDYRADVYQKKYLVRSEGAMKEALAFKYGPGGAVMHPGEESKDPAAGSTNHGDHVMASAIAAMLCRPMVQQAVKTKKALPPSILSLAGRRQWALKEDRVED